MASKPTLGRSWRIALVRMVDELTPPGLRDVRWLWAVPFRVLFGPDWRVFLDFKDRVLAMTDEEFAEVYAKVDRMPVRVDTDLNQACIDRILGTVVGPAVLDAGCGRGVLAGLLAARFAVTGVDVALPEDISARHPAVTFDQGSIEGLPYGDASFDTVVCSHTLEHVRNFDLAVAELRRVARRRLVIVVPRQRAARYTFNLHLHFFPYPQSLELAMGPRFGGRCEEVDGDLFYVEDRPQRDLDL